jgi:hypothetical protein
VSLPLVALPFGSVFLFLKISELFVANFLCAIEMVVRKGLRYVPEDWLDMCVNFEAMFASHLMPYTVQPNVMLGRLEITSLFLRRASLLEQQITFGSILVPERLSADEFCSGCETAYLVQNLVRTRQWNFVTLPIDGMKSVIFRSSSPTLCIATGE